ncbi:hypothetical protein ACQEU5_03510 [Marinactinospora thermotolerans]|uniref:hypothetical protein n=1 Tax=Marinactinospora thermotolerans TaxID=531310 RepID=UPI003D8AE495
MDKSMVLDLIGIFQIEAVMLGSDVNDLLLRGFLEEELAGHPGACPVWTAQPGSPRSAGGWCR